MSAARNEPLAVLSAPEIRFATQPQGIASPPQTVVVSNAGDGNLAIAAISIDGDYNQQFNETHNCPAVPATLPPRGSCAIQVVFKPEIAGDLSATLSISDNASGSPQSVVLYGSAGPAEPRVLLAPTVLSFGSHHLNGPSSLQVVLLKNTGSAALHITSAIRVDGPYSSEFHLRSVHEPCPEDTGLLAPNSSCSIGVAFTPVSTGNKDAQVVIEDDAAGSPHTVELSGTGT